MRRSEFLSPELQELPIIPTTRYREPSNRPTQSQNPEPTLIVIWNMPTETKSGSIRFLSRLGLRRDWFKAGEAPDNPRSELT